MENCKQYRVPAAIRLIKNSQAFPPKAMMKNIYRQVFWLVLAERLPIPF
jgi:hypothetical protein